MKDYEYYSGRDLQSPKKPSKPRLCSSPGPDDYRVHADLLEVYEKELSRYTSDLSDYRSVLNARHCEFVDDLCSESGLSKEQFAVIFRYAWEEGHSNGYHEVDMVFTTMMEMAKEFMRAS